MKPKDQRELERVILEVYYDTAGGGWSEISLTPAYKRMFNDFLVSQTFQNPMGRRVSHYKLSDAGKVVLSFIQNRLNRHHKSDVHGMILEKRTWSLPHIHNHDPQQLVLALEELAKLLDVRCESFENWTPGQTRVVIHNLEEALIRTKVMLHKTSNTFQQRYMSSDVCASIFDVLSKHLKELRDNGPQSEFVVW